MLSDVDSRVFLNTLDRQVNTFAEQNIDGCLEVVCWTWDGEKGFIEIHYTGNGLEAKCKAVALEAVVNQ